MIRWITGWTGADVGLGSRSSGTISGRAWILVYRLELVEKEHNRRCTVSSSCRPLPLDVNPPTSTKNMKYPGFSIRHCRSWYETRYNIHVASLSNNSSQLGSFVHIYLVTLVDYYVAHSKESFASRMIGTFQRYDSVYFV